MSYFSEDYPDDVSGSSVIMVVALEMVCINRGDISGRLSLQSA